METKTPTKTKEAFNSQLLIKHILAQSLRYGPTNEIVYRDINRYNYLELNIRVRKLANALQKLGVKAGDVVGIMDYDSHRYLECYFAIPMMGAVLHNVNYRLSPDQLLFMINKSDDKVIIVHEDFIPLLVEIKDKFTSKKIIIPINNVEILNNSKLEFQDDYERLLASEKDTYAFPELDENSVATILFTIGTTGKIKGVSFTHRQLVLHTLGLATAMGATDSRVSFRSNDVYMPLTPLFHTHAWGFPYLATLLGAKQVFVGRHELFMIFNLLENEKVTFSNIAPSMLQMIVKYPGLKKYFKNKWKFIVGGSGLTKELALLAEKAGMEVISGYGLSETCPVLTIGYLNNRTDLTSEERIKKRTDAGTPLPFVELSIEDNTGKITNNPNSIGEIVVRAPWATVGYLCNQEKSKVLWHNGYLHTQDIGSIGNNGILEVYDRMPDVIKSGNEWVSSSALESVICNIDGISEVAVVAMPDPKWVERPYALVVLEDGEKLDKEDIRIHLQRFVDKGVLSRWAIPKQIDIISEIPKTKAGKINKKVIRLSLVDSMDKK